MAPLDSTLELLTLSHPWPHHRGFHGLIKMRKMVATDLSTILWIIMKNKKGNCLIILKRFVFLFSILNLFLHCIEVEEDTPLEIGMKSINRNLSGSYYYQSIIVLWTSCEAFWLSRKHLKIIYYLYHHSLIHILFYDYGEQGSFFLYYSFDDDEQFCIR